MLHAMAAAGNLKVVTINLEKEAWENVAAIVYKSFTTYSGNMQSLKRWADRQDERCTIAAADKAMFEARVDQIEAGMKSLQTQLQALTGNSSGSSDERILADDCSLCLSRLERCIGVLFSQFGDLGPTSPSRSPVDGETPLPPETSRIGDGLEAQLPNLEQAIKALSSDRDRQENSRTASRAELEEMKQDSENMKQQLALWREILKENSEAVDAFGDLLAATQGVVHDLEVTQVHKSDLAEQLQSQNEAFQQRISGTDDAMKSLTDLIEARIEDVCQLVAAAERENYECIERRNKEVARVLESQLNPVNAYLNTMHVKIEAGKIEFDTLQNEVNKMHRIQDDMRQQAKVFHETHGRHEMQLEAGTRSLRDAQAKLESTVDRRVGEMSAALKGLLDSLGGEIGTLRASLAKLEEVLSSVRGNDLHLLTTSLHSLEQKVAKWVHATHLPAKVSEARLFSLEVRLAEEMEARLTLESKVSKTPREHSLALMLPQLSTTSVELQGVAATYRSDPKALRKALTSRRAPKEESFITGG